MKTQQFETNIKCGGCVAAVTPKLNEMEGVKWSVDLTSPKRILTVEGDVTAEAIEDAVEACGFMAKPVEG